MSAEISRPPIELNGLSATRFSVIAANVMIQTGESSLSNPLLTLEGEEDAFSYLFENGELQLRENDQGGNVVIQSGRGGSFSSISFGGGSVVIGGGNSSIRINGREVSGSNISISTMRRRASLLLPQYYVASHTAESKSGDIELGDLSARQLRIATISGDIALRTTSTQDLALKTVSGDIEIEDTTSKNGVIAQTISGDIEVTDSIAPSWSFSTISGNIRAKNTSGRIDPSTISGKVRIS